MRFKLMVVAASSAGLLSSTMAQAEEATNFVGPSIALGAGYFAPKMGVIKNNPATFGKIDSSRKKGFIPTVDLSYGFPMGSSAVGSVGMTYDIGKSKISEFKAQSDKTKIASQVRGDISLKNHASIYFAPGVRLGPDWLLYSKVGYHQASAKYNGDGQINGTAVSANLSTKLTGYGLGLGANWAMNKHTELRMEVEHIRLGNTGEHLDDKHIKLNRANLLVGYRF